MHATVGLERDDGPAVRDGAGSAAYRWYVAIFLTVASTMSVIDRQVLALMIGPVKRDLGVSDSMMGLLGGLAFTLFYTILTLPMAWWADRGSRRRIVIGAVAFWSAATIACGLAASYGQLFFARMCVGVGEAALIPTSVSLLADYFDRKRLPMALGLFAAAPLLGVGIANMAGGLVVDRLEAMGRVALPLIGAVQPWQAMFVMVGVPGIVLALIGFSVAEPPRTGQAVQGEGGIPMRAVIDLLRRRGAFLALMFIAYTALAMQGWGLFFWVVELLVRDHHVSRATAGFDFGILALVMGGAGSWIAGLLSGRMMRGGRPDATLRLVLVASLALIPLGIAAPLVPGYGLAMLLFAGATFFMGWPNGLGNSALASVVPNELRGRIIALYLVVVNFLSFTLGPLLGGLIGDHVFAGRSLGLTLATMAAVNYPIGAVCIWLSLGHFRRALDEAAAWRDDQA